MGILGWLFRRNIEVAKGNAQQAAIANHDAMSKPKTEFIDIASRRFFGESIREALRRVLMMSLRCRIGAEVGIGAGYCSGSDLCGFEGLYFGLQAQFYPSTARRLRCR
jgi:hypothetical protein